MASRRNRIKSDLMEALQMLKFSIKGGSQLNFTMGLSRDDELVALEELALSDTFVPEELSSFTDTLTSPLEDEVFYEPDEDGTGSADDD